MSQRIRVSVDLAAAVNAAAPGTEVAVGTFGDPASVVLRPESQAARTVVDGWDWSDAAQAVRDADRYPERRDLRAAAAQAVSDNDTFLAVASPSNAQVLAQVKALTRQNSKIIRRLSQID